ncbi:MAG: hypothetical protein ABSD39_02635 [Terriglobales bacterium]|jgi:hypothetical protein
MAAPAIIWRNPQAVQRRRLWNQARRDANGRLYIVVRSTVGDDSGWEGLPNLEVIEGGHTRANCGGLSRGSQPRA